MFSIDTLHVKEIEFEMQNGVTKPLRSILDGNKRAIIKTFNNEQGNLILINELVCYQLAIILNIPMPESGICICDKDTIDTSSLISDANYGYGFYSTYKEKNVILQNGIIKMIINLNDFYKILLLDHIIYNKDRNIGNLLVEFRKKNIFLTVIDHSHVFKNQTIWDDNCFKEGILTYDYNDLDILEYNEDTYNLFFENIKINSDMLFEQADKFISLINEPVLSDIMSEIPNDWIVNGSSLDKLKEYLLYRVSHILDICELILNYLKNRH